MNLRILFRNTRRNLYHLTKPMPLFSIAKFRFCSKTEAKQSIYEENEEGNIYATLSTANRHRRIQIRRTEDLDAAAELQVQSGGPQDIPVN